MSKRRKWLRRLLILSLFLTAVWLSLSYAVANRLTRRMNPWFAEPAHSIDWGVIEPLQLKTEGSQQINGWFIETDSKKPVVLILHGNGACRTWMMNEAEMVVRAGFAAMLISMRAHGDSSGEFNDIGYSARHDVIAAVQWLRNRFPNRKIVIWGQSMGAAAALFAGEKLGDTVSGYILETPYKDLKTAVWIRLKQQLPRVFSHAAYAGLLIVSNVVVPDLNEISPHDAIAKLPKSVQILILAGSRDPLATLPESEALAQCSGPQCRLVKLETDAHIPALKADRKSSESAIIQFLKSIE